MKGSIFLDHDSRAEYQDVVCPGCGAAARRSRRRKLERAIFFLRAYRCSKCERRFRKLTLRAE
jgi:DNA-directed RNA polymerase subunit RPC12/RpoP